MTLILLKLYNKPLRNMIEMSVWVLIITEFFITFPVNSDAEQSYNKRSTDGLRLSMNIQISSIDIQVSLLDDITAWNPGLLRASPTPSINSLRSIPVSGKNVCSMQIFHFIILARRVSLLRNIFIIWCCAFILYLEI